MRQDDLKALAKQRHCSVKDLIVLAPANDPFYCGTPSQLRDAEWFANLWEQLEFGRGVHLRRIHYRLVSHGDITKADGSVYQNTERDWNYLSNASKFARYLGLADAADFVDKRNPDPIIRASYDYMNDDPHPYIEFSDPYWEIPIFDMDLDSSWSPQIPYPAVSGFDYSDSLQPFHLEIWVEKSTMNDVLLPICGTFAINLTTSLGFQSISSVLNLIQRGQRANKSVRIFYISDFDPAGSLMPQAVARQIEFWVQHNSPNMDIALKPIVLTRKQVTEHELPRVPIKETDLRKAGFENRMGEGAVELDALEALYPGKLAEIVRSEILPYRDLELSQRYEDAYNQAWQNARDQWNVVIEGYRDELQGLSDEVLMARNKYAPEFEAILDRYKEEIRPHEEKLENIRQAIKDEMRDFTPELPEVPEPEKGGDETDWLYHSKRSYEEQLQYYKGQTAAIDVQSCLFEDS